MTKEHGEGYDYATLSISTSKLDWCRLIGYFIDRNTGEILYFDKNQYCYISERDTTKRLEAFMSRNLYAQE